MADVRAIVLYAEQDPQYRTFKTDGTIVYTASNYDGSNHSAQVGKAVAIVADSQVGLGASGNYPIGKLVKVESDGFVTVQVKGTMALPYNTGGGTPPIVGRGVQVDGTGLVISPAGGVRLATERGIVLSLDATNGLAYVDL